jgi:hypothetical protein
MAGLIRRFRRWLAGLLKPVWIRHVSRVDAADEIPLNPAPREVVLVGAFGSEKWIAFACPCERGHRILLNLQQSAYPRWSVSGPDRRLSLFPSVWVGSPWGCHFWLRRGRIRWAGPNEHGTAAIDHQRF